MNIIQDSLCRKTQSQKIQQQKGSLFKKNKITENQYTVQAKFSMVRHAHMTAMVRHVHMVKLADAFTSKQPENRGFYRLNGKYEQRPPNFCFIAASREVKSCTHPRSELYEAKHWPAAKTILPSIVAILITTALQRPSQENCEFKSSLGYIMRPYLNKR